MAQTKTPAGGKAGEAKPAEAPASGAVEEVEAWPGKWPDKLPQGLWPRLLLAQAHGGSISKSGRNEHHSYDYVRAEDVIRDASKILSRAGLVAKVGPEWEIKLTEGSTRSGGRTVECEAKSKLTIINPDKPEETVDFPIIGTGTDSPGDKAIYKAQTGGKKYAWQDALTLAFGDDPEDSSGIGAAAAADQQARGSGGPPFGPPSEAVPQVRTAIAYLLGGQEAAEDEAILKRADRLLETLTKDGGGYVPKIAGRALLHVAADLKAAIEQGAGDPAGGPGSAEDGAERAEADAAQSAAEGGDPPPTEDPPAGDAPPESELPADTEGLGNQPDPGDDIPF